MPVKSGRPCQLVLPQREHRLIKVFLNGQETEISEGLNLVTFLAWLKLPTDRVAVERNLAIVPRDQWAGTFLETGDRLEVVHFVGGG